MDQITLKNFRCFRGEQTARLAPLTLLVGENSTGKTSFLAMIRSLWDVACAQRLPDFKEEPYDLGSFDDIAHYRAGRGGRATTFEAGFSISPISVRRKKRHRDANDQSYWLGVTFKKKGTVPAISKMRFARNNVWGELRLVEKSWRVQFGTSHGEWQIPHAIQESFIIYSPLEFLNFLSRNRMLVDQGDIEKTIILKGSNLPSNEDLEQIKKLVHDIYSTRKRQGWGYSGDQLYASAPVRSKPHRTYDPARTTRDPSGDHVPMFLAGMYWQNKEKWETFKAALEDFGQKSGLFDEIAVKPLGKHEGEPFQVHIKKYGRRAKGPQRNLIDVGYGVSQALPIITELLRPDASPVFLLQQPEVHLHPSAQAALGSLFCQIAANRRQLIIETHSDHLLDRVRMDIRDGKTSLKPEDVSILFFDRGDLDVTIHSLRIDKEGNIQNMPPNYRRFFLEETKRSLGF